MCGEAVEEKKTAALKSLCRSTEGQLPWTDISTISQPLSPSGTPASSLEGSPSGTWTTAWFGQISSLCILWRRIGSEHVSLSAAMPSCCCIITCRITRPASKCVKFGMSCPTCSYVGSYVPLPCDRKELWRNHLNQVHIINCQGPEDTDTCKTTPSLSLSFSIIVILGVNLGRKVGRTYTNT